MLAASDWLSVCFKRAQSFADNAKSIEGRGEHHSAVVARYLGAYHLLRGAARLYRVPTNEEERTRAFDPVESPEDVRLGYIELGLSKDQTQFGERLGTWEYALRYKPQLLTYVPNAEEVRLWADAVFDAYALLFAETLNLPDPQPTESY